MFRVLDHPLEITTGTRLQQSIVLVPILRAGQVFFEGILDLIPETALAAGRRGPLIRN